MKPVHEELKEIRLKKNISLKKISEKTKIRLDFLEKLEDGDYSFVPAPYLRAFLREYGEMVGVDPNLVLKKLDGKISTLLAEENSGAPVLSDVKATVDETLLKEPVTKQPAPVISVTEHESAGPEIPSSVKQKTKTPRVKKEIKEKEETPPQKELFEEKQIKVVSPEQDETTEKEKTEAYISAPEQVRQPRRSIEIEEPKSSGVIIFIVFVIIIFIVAMVIFFLNKGGLF